jgi:hypothetical protein
VGDQFSDVSDNFITPQLKAVLISDKPATSVPSGDKPLSSTSFPGPQKSHPTWEIDIDLSNISITDLTIQLR